MIGRLIRWIFLEKSARTMLDKKRKGKKAKSPKKTGAADQGVSDADVAVDEAGGNRAQLREDALAAFRQRRSEFEKLDPDVQDKIAAVAQRAFDGNDKSKKTE